MTNAVRWERGVVSRRHPADLVEAGSAHVVAPRREPVREVEFDNQVRITLGFERARPDSFGRTTVLEVASR